MSRAPYLLLVALALSVASCGSSTGAVASGSSGTSGPFETSTSVPVPDEVVTAPSPSMLLAGLPAGISESMRPPGDLDEVIAASALTAVTRLARYELNPAAQPDDPLPDIYVPGYAGPRGVLRLVFDVEEVVGGRDAGPDLGVADGGEIAVDLEHWLATEQQSTQNDALDRLIGRPERYILVLREGEVGGVRTGAYRLWGEPNGMGSYREDQPGGELRIVYPDHDLVLREAIERGATVTTTAPHPTGGTIAADSTSEPEIESPGSPEPFASGEGLSVEAFLARYQTA